MATTTSPSSQGEGSFTDQLRALASDASLGIVKVLASHKPTPVPVSVLAEKLGIERSVTSKYLARLRGARLVGMAGRKRGYFADTGQIKAVIGVENYTRIIQDLQAQNEDTPGQSQD